MECTDRGVNCSPVVARPDCNAPGRLQRRSSPHLVHTPHSHLVRSLLSGCCKDDSDTLDSCVATGYPNRTALFL